jgi:predicted esterase YcpF (UPF0227 family)
MMPDIAWFLIGAGLGGFIGMWIGASAGLRRIAELNKEIDRITVEMWIAREEAK